MKKVFARSAYLLATFVMIFSALSLADQARASEASPFAGYVCGSQQTILFDNSNGGLVGNGGTPPTFSTNGLAYCLDGIETYHWNDGKGATPGKLWLQRVSGPAGLPAITPMFQALGSTGINNVANANFYMYVPAGSPVIIDGTYLCEDSDHSSWAQDSQSGGKGFCHIKVKPAIPASGAGASTAPVSKTAVASTPSKMKASSPAPIYAGAIVVIAVAALLIYRRVAKQEASNSLENYFNRGQPQAPKVNESKPTEYEGSAIGKDGIPHGLFTEKPLAPWFGDSAPPPPYIPLEEDKSTTDGLKVDPESELPQVEGGSPFVDGETM